MKENNYFTTLEIKDGVCAKAGVTSQWSGLTSLGVHAFRNPNECTDLDRPSEFAPCDGNVHMVKQTNIILNEPELRKLVNESNSTFVASRTVSGDSNIKLKILELSREHRSSIRQCIENLQRLDVRGKVTPEESERHNVWIDILDNIELIWHLCELLHLEVVHSEVVLPKLVEWVRFHSSDYDLRAGQVLEGHMKGAEQRYDDYWDLVTGLLLEGRFEATRALLRLHSEADSPAFREADNLLREIPVYKVYCGLSPAQFTQRWRGWKSTVRSKIKLKIFETQQNLLKIMRIMGDEEPLFPHLRPHCPTWYHMLTALLLFSDPMVRAHDLNYHAHQCIPHYGGSANLKLLDYTILALLDSNLPEAVDKLQLTPDNGWCAVHLTNLLYLNGCLKKTSVDLEPMLLDYGQLLMSHKRFWLIGLTYLDYCKTYGKDTIAVILESLPLEDDRLILRVVQAAKDRGLQDVVHNVCKTLTMKDLKEGNLARALTWSLMCKDVELTSQIADRYLHKYAAGSADVELGCNNVLAGLGQSVLLSSRLTFLTKYCDFQKLYQQGEIKDAAHLLIRLLDSKVSPKYFWFTLLLDALPILEVKGKPIFSHDDTTVLMACLEELSIGWIDNPVEKSSNFNEQIKLIRLAITKNLAKTLLSESSKEPGINVLVCY